MSRRTSSSLEACLVGLGRPVPKDPGGRTRMGGSAALGLIARRCERRPTLRSSQSASRRCPRLDHLKPDQGPYNVAPSLRDPNSALTLIPKAGQRAARTAETSQEADAKEKQEIQERPATNSKAKSNEYRRKVILLLAKEERSTSSRPGSCGPRTGSGGTKTSLLKASSLNT